MRLRRPSSDPEHGAPLWLRLLTLTLLVLYPVAWFAPLMRAGLLPLFGLDEISVITGLASLWQSDVFLALIVALFALIAPMAKTLGMVLLQWAAISPRIVPVIHAFGRLAMADIFLIALYITIAKGIGVGTVEVAWGLYLFTGCILAGLLVGNLTDRYLRD